MTGDNDTATAQIAATHIDHMSAFLRLDIRPEWRDDVIAHFRVMARAAEGVMAFDLPEDCEPAEIFRP